jgi:hypothetical protein
LFAVPTIPDVTETRLVVSKLYTVIESSSHQVLVLYLVMLLVSLFGEKSANKVLSLVTVPDLTTFLRQCCFIIAIFDF